MYLGAEFGSYAEFKNALKQYCASTQINGEPVSFIRFKSSTLKNANFDEDAQAEFKYMNSHYRCKGKVHKYAAVRNIS